MDWTIDPRNVESSFNRIAKELLTSYALYANAKEFRITEIEFYFYHPEHPDNYTHPHKRKKGEWRFHNQGLDITLSGNETQDGGILIRGIKNDRYVNGPRKIIYYLFQHFDNVESSNSLELKKK
nr:hypothetical protein [Bacteroidota bacterium]